MNIRKIPCAVLCFLLVIHLLTCSVSCSESFTPDLLLTGHIGFPVKMTVSSPEYNRIARFGEERTAYLNKLMKHFTLTVILDGSVSQTTLMIDQDPVVSIARIEDESDQHFIYSFDSENVR